MFLLLAADKWCDKVIAQLQNIWRTQAQVKIVFTLFKKGTERSFKDREEEKEQKDNHTMLGQSFRFYLIGKHETGWCDLFKCH